MRRSCLGIVGIVLAAAIAGCGDTGVQEGTVPFKGTSTEQFNEMKNETQKNVKTQAYAKKLEGDAKPAGDTKPADSKPAGDAKPADPKPAGDAKPGAEPKPASKSE
jgi:hypothetical protein